MLELKNREDLKRLRVANKLVAELLDRLKQNVKPGVTTLDLERLAERLLKEKQARGAFKGLYGYPCNLCTSINSEVVHGIPSQRSLREGDIVSLDFGVLLEGYYGDAAITVPVGKVSPEVSRLLEVAEKALYMGIDQARPGNRVSDISQAIQGYAEGQGYSVVRQFVGHGIGRKLHEPPQVPNFGPPWVGVLLESGMVLAIEPMINAGRPEVKIMDDGWTAVTKDGSLSVHFEHSVAIRDDGPLILSQL
jgi:methionyl aminopeptidase